MNDEIQFLRNTGWIYEFSCDSRPQELISSEIWEHALGSADVAFGGEQMSLRPVTNKAAS